MAIAAAGLTVAGLAVLLWGTAKAAPFAFFGTPEERAEVDAGRQLMLLAAAVLLVAAVVVGARSGLVRAIVVASPGVGAVVLIYAFPKSAAAWLPVLVLGTAALLAVLTALRSD